MLVPSFSCDFKNPIINGQITIGKLDGKIPAIIGTSTGGKLVVLTPDNVND